jgi:hypothetical protein
LHPAFGSAINFVPPLFVLYLLLMPLWAWLGWLALGCTTRYYLLAFDGGTISDCYDGIGWLPLALYLLALIVQTAWNCCNGVIKSCCALPLLFATHLFYGLGFWRGLFSRVDRTKPASTDVTFDRIAL